MPHDLNRRRSLKSILIGDRAFYAMVLGILIPIVIQNAITNFVNLLDNIMVGQVGTEQMSGVAIANQLMFVFNLCVFGGMAGAGIFSAQFHGAGNQEGVRSCFRFKLCMCAFLLLAAMAVFLLGGRTLIMQFLHDESDPGRISDTLSHGLAYLHIMLWGLPAFSMTQVYAGTLRETGETKLPMYAGVAAVFVNLVFNYLLIFGHFGFPKLGVEGAAIATVISRYVELSIVAFVTHTHANRFPFIRGIYRTLRVPGGLARDITIKGLPLLLNEGLWSLGMTMLTHCYSLRGLDVVAALNISSTISNLFAVTFISMGGATAILVGQSLGANALDEAKDRAWKLIAFGIAISIVTALLMAVVAPLIPRVYRTSAEVRSLATAFLRIYALCMPMFTFCNCAYFIMRSGGKTLITFVFDSVYTWAIGVPIAWCLVHFTALPVVAVYLCVQMADLIKCAFGYAVLRMGIWMNNMVS